MRWMILSLGMLALAACNDDGSGGSDGGGAPSSGGAGGSGGSVDGGGGGGGAPPGGLVLDIAADNTATVRCATFINGVWGTAETTFVTNVPESDVANPDCALVAVIPDGETAPFWITSASFEEDRARRRPPPRVQHRRGGDRGGEHLCRAGRLHRSDDGPLHRHARRAGRRRHHRDDPGGVTPEVRSR